MDEDIERLVVQVRADTQGFARDVATMREQIEGPFSQGMARAGQRLESALLGAVRRGKFGFDELRGVALAVLDDIASAALRTGLGAATGGGGGGLLGLASGLLSSALGLPGRATGGPVSPGRAYLVGERGPEVFMPSGFGRVEPPASQRSIGPVRLVVQVNGGQGQSSADALQRSSRQVARAVRRALES